MPVKVPEYGMRQYDHEYNKAGFIMAGSDVKLNTQYANCGEILSWPMYFILFCPFFGHVIFFVIYLRGSIFRSLKLQKVEKH